MGQRTDLLSFLKLLGGAEGFRCEFTDIPDLLITEPTGHIIGVEHTRIYVNNPKLASGRQRKPQEIIQLSIISEAHHLFRQKSLIPLWLTVTFSEPFDHRKEEVTDVARALADAVYQLVSRGEDLRSEMSFTTIGDWELKRLGLPTPKGIKQIHYMVEDDTEKEVWGPSYGYGVPELGLTLLKEIVASKDSKVSEYRKRCDEVWLLIVTDLGMPSSHFRLNADVNTHIFLTQFSHLFLMTDSNNRLVELNVSA